MTTKPRVLITGGAAGIGLATAERCRAEGYEPVVTDRDGDGIRADLSDPAATAVALEQALAGGPIARLVDNVGIVRAGPVEEQSLADLDAVVSLDLRCSLQCVQALLSDMKAAGCGRIVDVASRTRAIMEAIPVRRIGTPEDVAHAVAFLLNDRGAYVTGQARFVCGGMTVGAAGH